MTGATATNITSHEHKQFSKEIMLNTTTDKKHFQSPQVCNITDENAPLVKVKRRLQLVGWRANHVIDFAHFKT